MTTLAPKPSASRAAKRASPQPAMADTFQFKLVTPTGVLFDGAVEGFDGAVGAGDHDAAFHDGENVGCEGFGVGVFWQAVFDLVDAFADGGDPALEVFGDEFVGGTVFGVDFEGEAAERAAVFAISLEDAAAVAG